MKTSILVGKTNKGKVYISQIGEKSFTMRTGKRHLSVVDSLKAGQKWLEDRGYVLKKKQETELEKQSRLVKESLLKGGNDEVKKD